MEKLLLVLLLLVLLGVVWRWCGARELAEAREGVGCSRGCGGVGGVLWGRCCGCAGDKKGLEAVLPVAVGADEGIVFLTEIR